MRQLARTVANREILCATDRVALDAAAFLHVAVERERIREELGHGERNSPLYLLAALLAMILWTAVQLAWQLFT